ICGRCFNQRCDMMSASRHKLDYDRHPIQRFPRWVVVVAIFTSIYFGGYAIAISNRHPAANAYYFVYCEAPAMDATLYVAFYPVQRLHRVCVGPSSMTHLRDQRLASPE